MRRLLGPRPGAATAATRAKPQVRGRAIMPTYAVMGKAVGKQFRVKLKEALDMWMLYVTATPELEIEVRDNAGYSLKWTSDGAVLTFGHTRRYKSAIAAYRSALRHWPKD